MIRRAQHAPILAVAVAVVLCGSAQTLHAQATDSVTHVAAQPARADDEDEDERRRLDRIVVTGSHIRRIEVEGPLPITTITREQLLARGELLLSDAIRDLSYNSFGSFGERPNSSIPNASQPNLRGLGSKYSLSLLDGHRLPGFPRIDGGAATSLTGIPMAAIDRIEVLRDGASAVYGSDAIGGVINLLTRRHDTEPQLEFALDHPQQDGGESRRASLVFGRSAARGSWLLAAEVQDREPLHGADRDYLIELAGTSPTANPGTYFRFDPVTEDYVGAGVADPRCPTALDSDPVFPSSVLLHIDGGTQCNYRFRDLNAERAGYEGRSLFTSARFDFSGTTTGLARVLMLDADHLTQIAPTPANGLIIAQDNPYNPTRGELGPELGYPLELYYRLTALGPRVTAAEEGNLHAQLGIEGLLDWAEGGDWSVALTHNRLDYDATYVSGYALRRAFAAALDSGRFNPFAAEPGNPAGLEDALYRPWETNRFRSTLLELVWSFDAGFVGGRSASYAFGFELDRAEYAIDADPELRVGEVLGFGGTISPEAAARNHAGIYGELLLPLSRRLEVSLAARYDRYQDAGGALSPKLAIAFRPTEHWLLRLGAGRGFQAPDLVTAYGGGYSYDAFLVDEVDCAAHPTEPAACRRRPLTVQVVPNRELGPERARQGSIGVVWQPFEALHAALDYYRTRVVDQIGVLDPEEALVLEVTCGQPGVNCDPRLVGQVIRNRFGNLEAVVLPFINIAGTETDGIDFELGARRATRYGDFSFDLQASKVFESDYSISPELTYGVLGAFGAPPWRGNAGLDWKLGDHGLNFNVKYVAGRGNCAPAVFPDGSRNPDCDDDRIASHTELGAQWRWTTPWAGEVAVGVRNLGNRPPPHSSDGGYQYGLYDPNGRVWYLRYRHAF